MAMSGPSLSFEGDVTESGVPAAGTPFVVQGYLYPEGTLEKVGLTNGVNEDGSPQLPDEVIGHFI